MIYILLELYDGNKDAKGLREEDGDGKLPCGCKVHSEREDDVAGIRRDKSPSEARVEADKGTSMGDLRKVDDNRSNGKPVESVRLLLEALAGRYSRYGYPEGFQRTMRLRERWVNHHGLLGEGFGDFYDGTDIELETIEALVDMICIENVGR